MQIKFTLENYCNTNKLDCNEANKIHTGCEFIRGIGEASLMLDKEVKYLLAFVVCSLSL